MSEKENNKRPAPVVPECPLGYGHGGKWCGPHTDCWLDPRSREERAAAPAQGQQVECQECERLRTDLAYFPPTVRQLAETCAELRAELAALKAQQAEQKPVAWRVTGKGGLTVTPEYPRWAVGDAELLIEALYTAPQPAPAQDVAGLVDEQATLLAEMLKRCSLPDWARDRIAKALAAHDKQSGDM